MSRRVLDIGIWRRINSLQSSVRCWRARNCGCRLGAMLTDILLPIHEAHQLKHSTLMQPFKTNVGRSRQPPHTDVVAMQKPHDDHGRVIIRATVRPSNEAHWTPINFRNAKAQAKRSAKLLAKQILSILLYRTS